MALMLAIEIKRAQTAWSEGGAGGYERLAADDVEAAAEEVRETVSRGFSRPACMCMGAAHMLVMFSIVAVAVLLAWAARLYEHVSLHHAAMQRPHTG